MPGRSPCGLRVDDPAALEQLRRVLNDSGYADTGIAPTVLADPVLPALPDEEGPATPLATLLRLFHMGLAVDINEAESSLCGLSVERLLGTGVIQAEGKRVWATAQIQPYGDRVFAVDLPARYRESEDVVMSVAPSSIELAHLTVRRDARKTLDLGTGSGIEAILAARHSEHVYAVDLNPRALDFAEFNCVLNGVRNVTCLQGSFLAPVLEERFDLIVSNPPFVISPLTQITFRDAGAEGDQLCVAIARQATQLLNEDGYFHMIYQWIQTPGTDWRDQLTTCFAEMGCDVFGIRILDQEPESYISDWTPELYAREPARVEALQREWLEYFQDRCAESIGTVLLTMRRCSHRPNSYWFEEAPEDRLQPYGENILTLFALRDYLRERTDGALLQEKLTISPHVAMSQKSRWNSGHWQSVATELSMERGLKYVYGDMDAVLEQVVSACDGRRTLQDLLGGIASERHLVFETAAPQYVAAVRELIQYGFLVPAARAELETADANRSVAP